MTTFNRNYDLTCSPVLDKVIARSMRILVSKNRQYDSQVIHVRENTEAPDWSRFSSLGRIKSSGSFRGPGGPRGDERVSNLLGHYTES